MLDRRNQQGDQDANDPYYNQQLNQSEPNSLTDASEIGASLSCHILTHNLKLIGWIKPSTYLFNYNMSEGWWYRRPIPHPNQEFA
jgi:hypothetical protein